MAKARPETISWLPWWLRSRMGRWLLRSAALLLVVVGLLAGLIALSRSLRDQKRYEVPVGEIDCNVPEGMSRGDFLDQVHYEGQLPDRLKFLDDELEQTLKQAFLRHPWVESVDDVTLTPPHNIAVKLTFRVPVLAVRWEGELRAVDGRGVRLPKHAPTEGLPVYDGEPRRPRGPPGTPWGDPGLEREARKRYSQTQ